MGIVEYGLMLFNESIRQLAELLLNNSANFQSFNSIFLQLA